MYLHVIYVTNLYVIHLIHTQTLFASSYGLIYKYNFVRPQRCLNIIPLTDIFEKKKENCPNFANKMFSYRTYREPLSCEFDVEDFAIPTFD